MNLKTFIKWFLTAILIFIYYVGLAYYDLVFNLDFSSRISQPGLKEMSTNAWTKFAAQLLSDHNSSMEFAYYGFAIVLVLIFIIHKKIR
ncbi:TPA: hypothetical protein ACS72K_001462 [Providencia alcalifaciens]